MAKIRPWYFGQKSFVHKFGGRSKLLQQLNFNRLDQHIYIYSVHMYICINKWKKFRFS